MKHKDFIEIHDYSAGEVREIFEIARDMKANPETYRDALKGQTLAMIFEKSSTRTRVSFEVGMFQMGGHALFLSSRDIQLGRGEPIYDTAKVLSRYVNGIMARTFAHKTVTDLAEYASVPVINGLTDLSHPTQAMTDYFTAWEHLGDLKGRKYVLTWTYHPRPLNTAVANSALMIATRYGMDVTLLCPTPEYVLDPRYMDFARRNVAENGGSLKISHDVDEAYRGAEVVYAKSWGAIPYFGRWGEEKPIRDRYRDFIVDERKMALTSGAVFSHCLPLRRNVKATDAVMDSKACIAVDEAENRLHVQKAIMAALVKGAVQ